MELKSQLKSMQDQKYEACNELDREWQEKFDRQRQELHSERGDLRAQIALLEAKLADANVQLGQGQIKE